MPLFTPTNQKRLTNVAVVRLKKAGKRFEIACYPNKVNAFRDKLERDLDEVLQARQVFTNVSKGEGAKKDELAKAFGHDDIEKICIEILEKGELQVSAKEREEQQDSQFKEIASIVASKCINPVTKKVYTVTSIEQAMRDCHLALRPNKSSKSQALEAIRKLKDSGLKIQRARMRLAIAVSKRNVVDKLRPLAFKIENENYDEESRVTTLTMLCEPSDYRTIDEIVSKSAVGAGDKAVVAKLDIVDLQVPLDEEQDDGEGADMPHQHSHEHVDHHHEAKGHAKGKHHDTEEEEEDKPKQTKKKAGKKAQAADSDEDDHPHRGGKKHQDISDIGIPASSGAKSKSSQKGPKAIPDPDSDEEDRGGKRRGARSKFADLDD